MFQKQKKQSGLGKYAGVHGVIRKSEIAAAKPSKGIVGKGKGKTTNYPMDSDEAFEKRLARYEKKKAEALAAQEAATIQEDKPAEVVPA